MDRLTIPDVPIEGGMRRPVVDVMAVREEAMTIYWALKKYEDTGLTPEEIREIDRLFAEKCRQLAVLTENFKALSKSHNERMDAEEYGCPGWIPVEKRLPEKTGDYWVAMRHLDGNITTEKMFWRPEWPHEDAWKEVVVAWQPYYCPEPFNPQNKD